MKKYWREKKRNSFKFILVRANIMWLIIFEWRITMKKVIKIIPLVLALFFVTACNKEKTPNGTNTDIPQDLTVEFASGDGDMFTDRDYEVGYSESDSIRIALNGDSISCNSTNVTIENNKATINKDGIYILSGTLNNGTIVVDVPDTAKPQLVFENVNINSENFAPLYVVNADKVFITLAASSENTLSNGGSFAAIDSNNVDGAIFSKADITFNGEGKLSINSPAGHGIAGKDDVAFTSGKYVINSELAGIDANDSVRIKNATFEIKSGKDGIHCENADDESKGLIYISEGKINIETKLDGISAQYYLQIESGDINIITGEGSANVTHSSNGGGMQGPGMGGGQRPGRQSFIENSTSTDTQESLKGIKASGSILIKDGNIIIDSEDDCLHANGSVVINDGTFTLASGDDGVHADETLHVTGGTISISKCYEGLEALNITVTGGNISLIASDDGLNAAGGTDSSGFGGMYGPPDMFGGNGNSKGSINISGGNLKIVASGDGLDANGTLDISGGNIVVEGPTTGDTATLDYDISGTINGGSFIGTGARGMAQSLTSTTQGVFAVSVGNQAAGTKITLYDSAGNELVTHTPNMDFAVVIISNPDLVSGKMYKIKVGEVEGEFAAQ